MSNNIIVNYEFDGYDAIIMWHCTNDSNHKVYNELLLELNDSCIKVTKLNYSDHIANDIEKIFYSIDGDVKKIVEYVSFTFHTKYKDYDCSFLERNVNKIIKFAKNHMNMTEKNILHLTLKRPYYEMNLPKPLIRLILNLL